MNPKDKAFNLFSSFSPIIDSIERKHYDYYEENEAKKCALICVDEILKEIQPKDPNDYCSPLVKSRAEYWVQVKQEINNL